MCVCVCSSTDPFMEVRETSGLSTVDMNEW